MYLQVTEELEKVKMEMEDRGSSMTDGGKFAFYCHLMSAGPPIC